MTKIDFDSKYSPIVMPEPFAGSGSKSLPANTQDDESGFSYPLGFNNAYSSPSSNNGKFVTRAQMNAIGNLATHNDFYHRCGGLNTFDPAFATAIGGYPYGAILDYIVGSKLFKVMSMVDNNIIAPSDQSISSNTWIILNQDVPTPEATKVASFSGLPIESETGRDGNVYYTGVSFIPLSVFQASRDASVYIGNINLREQEVTPNNITSETGIDAMDVIIGWGIFFKDLGADRLSVESIQIPTYNNLNGWKQITGVGETMSSFRVGSGPTNYWNSSFSLSFVTAGNYYSIGVFVGCSRYSINTSNSTAYQIMRRVTGKSGDDSNFSFDLFYR